MERYFEIGKVAGTHGIKGTLRVFPTTEDPSRYELLKEIMIEHKGKKETFHIEKIAYHKKFVLVTVKEIKDINIAEEYKGATILIPESSALPLASNEYYIRDLYGLRVITEDGEDLGELVDIYETGANDVYAVKKGDEKELLIPAISQCIIKVDIPAGEMVVRLLEGLR
ncbi:MAG: 16S rRNA processing protein RimM [Epulopiscium sp.]|jgi:16S rRNA processing protein RimM|nr:16S rRNA processing protein RimM [Candidatus Epulonipiscium sp.]